MGSTLKSAKSVTTTTSPDLKKVTSVSETPKATLETLPKGSTVLKKDISVTVEEIENGFLITKNFDIKYQAPSKDYSDYLYYAKKWFSEENPLEIRTDDKSLADLFE